MNRQISRSVAFLLLAAGAVAAQTVTYNIVPVTPTFDPYVLTWDILVSVRPNDDWTAAGIKATTGNGAKWFYDLDQAPDANFPTAPGTATPNKFSTFLNNPRSQFADGRFTSPTTFAGAYDPTAFDIKMTPTELNAAWLELPPDSTSLDTNAAVARLSLDTHNSPYHGWSLWINTFGAARLATVDIATGTVLNGGVTPKLHFEIWASNPPEPATGLLLLAGGFALARHR